MDAITEYLEKPKIYWYFSKKEMNMDVTEGKSLKTELGGASLFRCNTKSDQRGDGVSENHVVTFPQVASVLCGTEMCLV